MVRDVEAVERQRALFPEHGVEVNRSDEAEPQPKREEERVENGRGVDHVHKERRHVRDHELLHERRAHDEGHFLLHVFLPLLHLGGRDLHEVEPDLAQERTVDEEAEHERGNRGDDDRDVVHRDIHGGGGGKHLNAMPSGLDEAIGRIGLSVPNENAPPDESERSVDAVSTDRN